MLVRRGPGDSPIVRARGDRRRARGSPLLRRSRACGAACDLPAAGNWPETGRPGQGTRAARERADRVPFHPDAALRAIESRDEYGAMLAIMRHGLDVLGDAPPACRARLLEAATFYDFLLERMPALADQWRARRDALRASGELNPHERRTPPEGGAHRMILLDPTGRDESIPATQRLRSYSEARRRSWAVWMSCTACSAAPQHCRAPPLLSSEVPGGVSGGAGSKKGARRISRGVATPPGYRSSTSLARR
jgi:hypothetical protein